MPVTFYPSDHGANAVNSWRAKGTSPSSILSFANRGVFRNAEKVWQTSLPPKSDNIIPSSNGFLHTILTAYNNHHALIIRPDDVWIAILTQFNYYVNANAEALRTLFVAHKGKKGLMIEQLDIDWGTFAKLMTEKIQKELVDPELRNWLLPSFTTTQDNDLVVASITMMATLKNYFVYSMGGGCGLPRVTLEGEKRDWQDVLARVGKLQEFGEQATAWYRLLEPVLKRFVHAFDDPHSEENIHFWQTVIHEHRNSSGGGSGTGEVASTGGWISAFFAFSMYGKWLGRPLDGLVMASDQQDQGIKIVKEGDLSTLAIDGVLYHRIFQDSPPPGSVSVDVTFSYPDNKELPCIMTAGTIGSQIIDSGDRSLSVSGTQDTLKPMQGWWVSVKNK